MLIHLNIKFLRKKKALTQESLSEALGISRSKLAGYELTITPPLDILVKISEYFGVSLDILIKEDLSSYSEYKLRELLETDQFLRGRKLRILSTTVDADGRELIEVVSQRAKASYLAGFADPEFISELPRFSLPFLPTDKKHRVFQVDGDSMLPIPDGSWIICEYIDDWLNIKDGERYVIVTEQDGVTFKIAYNRIQSEQKLLLCSSNPIYSPFEVEIEQVREVWRYRLLMSE
ncbi:MAG TPA: transcriptional regulator [Algoriphagus sp.]|jgi:transcriptional regulator with XRE-family HTH domain|uniref:XRE family transcriptional regulator n=1 Tax=unclassified Algoriphagus TaxID=2641541 RepID=UPI000C3776A6|nr:MULTISPECIES: LexA family transcriptional regulator [unclassified Algoriphagus]MAL12885.1 transcriptional regulator [Algoriphagus sp.]MAN85689.1 transcriptional regulator [Algoriphagus sp.]QYH39159.1 LexA family transcriptional regulator [Algoriphagus sp. NBT04N3]HAD50008.1 transcriptional regulator [Algoriphagus sp.]HAS58423.1 transcriptional regulator [Algoriphagus sp.]|tara:strand:+ start:5233 stop:5931 length:699 start_codon:yes stop_codon:yes gene_type:complete